MDTEHPSNHGPIAHHHMTGHRHTIGDHDPITQFTVVTEMAIGHQQIATPQPGFLLIGGGPVDRDALSDGVVISQNHRGGIAGVLEILGLKANAGSRENMVAGPHAHPAIEHHMGADLASGTNFHLGPDDGIGTHLDPGA